MGLYKVDETTADLTLVAGLPSAGDVMDFKYMIVTYNDLISASGWTAPYAGIMMANVPGNASNRIAQFKVNGRLVALNGTAENLYRGSTFAVPKGGVVTTSDMSGSNNFYAVFAYITGNAVVDTTLLEYPKRYVVDGYILNGNVIRGYGRATVMLYANGQAVIDYACRVTTANMTGDVFGYGISPKILHQNNSNIPLITPKSGGTVMYYRTGSESGVLYPQQELVHLSGTHTTVQYGADMYWQFARLYEVGTEPGAWPTRSMPLDTYIQGTCYGTFSV